jgi:predicted cation transporter
MLLELRYVFIFVAIITHIYGTDVHNLAPKHLKFHLDDVAHTDFVGISPLAFQYLYVGLLAMYLAYDKYKPSVTCDICKKHILTILVDVLIVVYGLSFAVLSIVSNINYRKKYDKDEQWVSILSAATVAISCGIFMSERYITGHNV